METRYEKKKRQAKSVWAAYLPKEKKPETKTKQNKKQKTSKPLHTLFCYVDYLYFFWVAAGFKMNKLLRALVFLKYKKTMT